MQPKTIITKIGSSLLTRGGVIIDINMIEKTAWQIAYLKRMSHKIFHVSSGAVVSDPNEARKKDERSVIGQCRLMSAYTNAFTKYGIEVAQILLTHADITGYYLKKGNEYQIVLPKVIGLVERIMGYPEVIGIANNNDATDNTEIEGLLDCRDNDNLAMHTALGLSIVPDMVIYASEAPGVLDKGGKVIPVVFKEDYEYVLSLAVNTNGCGYGITGAKTKISACINLALNGIDAWIVPGREENCYIRAAEGEKNFGTYFPKL